ncbi:hypothetical protein [Streptomyces venezuelae]
MRARPFSPRPAIHAATWAHPYGHGRFSPFLYADGGDGESEGAGQEGGDSGDSGTEPADKGREETPKPPSKDWQAEAEKWQSLARKHEARAKENSGAAKELGELRKQSMTEQEKAVEEAAAKARTEERVRLAGKLARQGFLAAAAGRIPHAAAVADDLNLSRYVGEDGEIDEKELAALVDRLAPAKPPAEDAEPEKKPARNVRGFDQGPRGSAKQDSSLASGRDLYAQRKKTNSFT